MKKLFIIIYIAVLTTCVLNANSRIEFNDANTFNIEIIGSYVSGSSFYDLDQKVIVLQKELIELEDTSFYLDYNFDYRKYLFGFQVEYNILDNFKVFGRLPFCVYTLEEKYNLHDGGTNIPKDDFSLSQPEYYAFGTAYVYELNGFYASGLFEARVPPGFHNGVLDSTDYEFLSDGAFQALFGVNAGYTLEKAWFEAGFTYFSRDEELVDQARYFAEAGLSSVPDTYLSATLYYISSLEPFDEAVPFNIRRTPVQEEYIGIDFGLRVDFESNIHAELSYGVKLDGKNTWKYGQVFFKTGIVF